jgi:sensor histidine kinase YesM
MQTDFDAYPINSEEINMKPQSDKRKTPGKIILGVLRDFLILIAIGNVISLFSISGNIYSLEVVLRNCMFSILIGYPAWKGMAFIVNFLDKKLPWLKYPIKRLIIQLLVMFLFVLLLMAIGLLLWMSFDDDLTLSSFDRIAFSSLKTALLFLLLSLLIGNAILFFKNWRDAAIKHEELKRVQLDLQFQTLKNQVKPHFLFNSFSSLITLINSDAEKATLFVHKLSDVYRYVLDQSNAELVAVSKEVKFLEDYIYLQKIRFGYSLEVKCRLDIKENQMIIPLSLQMIVENAIKHNEASEENTLFIEIFSTKEDQIVIKNSLNKIEMIENSHGIGLENLKKRIAFFTEQELIISDGPDYFTVTLPTILS